MRATHAPPRPPGACPRGRPPAARRRRRQHATRRRAPLAAALACALLALAGCGAGDGHGDGSSASRPGYVTEPFSREQELIAKGAPLMVADGCASCHLASAAHGAAPSFSSFAGHRVTLADGRRVLVDERFVREGLLHPQRYELKGYDPTPMLGALARLRLTAAQAEAMAAFIEQVGPETE